MKINKLDNDCAERLIKRLSDEYAAFYFYKNATNYCRTVGYSGGEKYFENEAKNELEHAKRLENYLSDWNVMPELKTIPKPVEFTGLKDIIEKAYGIEYRLYLDYEADSLAIIDEDASTFTFLQFYLNVQTESVAEYSTLLNKIDLVGDDKFALFYFDKEVLGQ